MVDADQFSAVKSINTVDAKEQFYCLLFAVRQFQEIFVGCSTPVDINSLKMIKVIRKFILCAFL